jgi:tripartite-type tricarboxylate transporter receptor subunit TctC
VTAKKSWWSAFALMLGLFALLLAASGVHAQQNASTGSGPGFPARSIRLIVPAAAGDPLDIQARRLATKLTESFGRPVVVDNRPGGNYVIGIKIALSANPDGYTVILVPSSYAANAAFYDLPYDSLNDVTPIAHVGISGFAVTLHSSLPIASIKELIEYDKTNPGKLHYGAAGTASGSHRSAELFNQMAGTRMIKVPYKGAGPALSDLLGGQIQIFFGNLPTMIPHINSKRLRGIAVTTARRSNALPEIPTVRETLAGYESVAWQGVLGPKGLPKDIVVRWNYEVNRIVQLSDVKAYLTALGVEPADTSPEQFHAFLEREIDKWQKVVKRAGIKPER